MATIARFLSFLFILSLLQSCQDEAYLQEISLFQFELNQKFADVNESPLTEADRKLFNKLPFFPVLEKYRVVAKFVRTPNEPVFEMETTTERKPLYKKYGEAYFELDHASVKLIVFQNQELIKNAGYENYLFLPFGDLTNGKESYGGGRFIDLKIPEGDQLIIDFNKSYNPYCAYNHEYSCPIPPPENRIELAIYAGVKAPADH